MKKLHTNIVECVEECVNSANSHLGGPVPLPSECKTHEEYLRKSKDQLAYMFGWMRREAEEQMTEVARLKANQPDPTALGHMEAVMMAEAEKHCSDGNYKAEREIYESLAKIRPERAGVYAQYIEESEREQAESVA